LITTFLSKRQLFPGNNFVMLEIQGKEVLSRMNLKVININRKGKTDKKFET
jgi:hypothetical protein